MDRHSSYIFIWLQLELCAMAVLLTKGGCPLAGRGAGSPGRGARGSRGGDLLHSSEVLRGGRGRARLACSYRLSGAAARLQSASRCSLLQLRCSKFASTLNCQTSRSQEARESEPEETPDPAPPFPYPH